MVIISVSITEEVSETIIRLLKQDLYKNTSKLFRSLFKDLTFLYEFMDQYMKPAPERPPNDYLNKIEKIGDIVNAIKG